MARIFVLFLLHCIALHGSDCQSLIDAGKKMLHEHEYASALSTFKNSFAIASSSSQLNEIGNNVLALGNILYMGGDIERAHEAFKQLDAWFPTSSTVAYNYGLSLHELARYKEAATLFEKSCTLNPQALDSRSLLATSLLALGDYTQGWQLYETRWEKPDKKTVKLSCPRWDGKTSLQGKRVLLLTEGALGDCMQFIRYAQLVREAGAYTIVQVPTALQKLLSSCPYIDSIVSASDPIGPIDFYTSLMSLPALCNTTLETIPQNIPYIFPDPTLIDLWKNNLPLNKDLKIGVCWDADPENDANRPPLAKRSIDPLFFGPLAKLPGITLYSLQKTDLVPPFMHNFGTELDTHNGRFMDSAAIIHNLDLILTVDTSIAHLSGALGKPTWLILPFKADWRWLENTVHNSPWYPGMKIFRKEKDESWSAVISRIAVELAAKIFEQNQRIHG